MCVRHFKGYAYTHAPCVLGTAELAGPAFWIVPRNLVDFHGSYSDLGQRAAMLFHYSD